MCSTSQFEFNKKFILVSDVCNLLQNMIEDLEELDDKNKDLGNLRLCIVRSEVIFT